jgi:quercetin dioxygenase-like cupin family protein
MNKYASLLGLSALFTATLVLAGTPSTDVMKVAPDHYRVLVDNAQVRVLENTLKPGEKDGSHTHAAGWYYVTRGGMMRVVHEGGKTEVWTPTTGDSGWMDAEAVHTSENVGPASMSFILVEVKSAAR